MQRQGPLKQIHPIHSDRASHSCIAYFRVHSRAVASCFALSLLYTRAISAGPQGSPARSHGTMGRVSSVSTAASTTSMECVRTRVRTHQLGSSEHTEKSTLATVSAEPHWSPRTSEIYFMATWFGHFRALQPWQFHFAAAPWEHSWTIQGDHHAALTTQKFCRRRPLAANAAAAAAANAAAALGLQYRTSRLRLAEWLRPRPGYGLGGRLPGNPTGNPADAGIFVGSFLTERVVQMQDPLAPGPGRGNSSYISAIATFVATERSFGPHGNLTMHDLG